MNRIGQPTRRDLSRLLALLAAAAATPALAQRRGAGRGGGRRGDAAAAWPYTDFGPAGQVASRSEVKELDLTFVRYANGVRLTVKPTALARDHALVRVRLGHGEQDLPKDRITAIGQFGSKMAEGGLADMTAEEVAAALRGHRVSTSFPVQPGAFVQVGVTTPEALDLQLQVLAAHVAHPGWRVTDLKDDALINGALYSRAVLDPESLFKQQAPFLLHSGDQRWRKADPASLAKLQATDIRATMEPILAKAPIEVVVVGDVTVDRVIDLVASTYGALPTREERDPSPAAREVHFPPPTREPLVLRHKGPADKAIVYVAWPTGGPANHPAFARRLLLEFTLVAMMEDSFAHGSFEATDLISQRADGDTYPGYGYMAVKITTSPDQVSKVMTAIDNAVGAIKTAVPQDMLENARKLRIDGLNSLYKQNSYWMVAIAGMQTSPRLVAEQRALLADTQAATAEDVRGVARDILDNRKAWRLIIAPEGASIPGQRP